MLKKPSLPQQLGLSTITTWPTIDGMYITDMCFKQNVAIFYTAITITLNLLLTVFPNSKV